MHTILRNLVWEDIDVYKKQFSDLAKTTFEQIIEPYEHEPKMLHAIVESRAMLNNMLKKIGAINEPITE